MGRAAKAFLGAAVQRFRAYVEHLAHSLGHADRREPLRGYRTVTWREGSAGMMRSRFAAVRVRLLAGGPQPRAVVAHRMAQSQHRTRQVLAGQSPGHHAA